MREWHLTASDPMAPRIAADARAGRTNYADDQVWQLRLGGPDEPALSLETRYGGRIGLARLLPIWFVGRRQVYETQGYHQPPVLTAFTPDTLTLRAGLTATLDLTLEFWTMESQAVGGRFAVHNSGTQAQSVQLAMTAQAARESKTLQMLYLTLETGEVALQVGRLPTLQPVLMVEGAVDQGANSRLGRALSLEPGQTAAVRWVLGSMPDRDASLLLAHRWLQTDWTRHLDAIRARAEATPQIETGRAEWDAALAWSFQHVLRAFLGTTGNLPHPSFVNSRRPNQGFAATGMQGSGFAAPWGGQSLPDALTIAPAVSLAAPELAKGIVRNFLAVQRDDGWIDARPGLESQRTHQLAPPLLASLAYTVYHYTGDRAFLADCCDGLLAFFDRWFKPDVDRDRDGVPEWQHLGQGAFADSPTLAQNRRWAMGVDIRTIEAPDLIAYLVREVRTLIKITELLDRKDDAAGLAPYYEALVEALKSMWDAETGVFRYRDRDTHTTPKGEVVFSGKGDQPLREETPIPLPCRLILRVSGGMSRKPNLGCTIEGIDGSGKPAHETLEASAFDWYRGLGSTTTQTVWRTLKYVKFDGLSRVYSVEVRTVDLSLPDQSLLVPLWTDALDDDQRARLLAQLTDPALYWRAYGICACPANSPVYDPAHANGCGGAWPWYNNLLAWALLDHGPEQQAADLFARLIQAQSSALVRDRAFRSLYNPDTGEGLGDTDTIEGAVSLGWFTRLFGAFVQGPGSVVIGGPLRFDGKPMIWTQYGVRVERGPDGSHIRFPSGHEVSLPPDAKPQVVRDPKAKTPAAVPVIEPPAPSDPLPPGGIDQPPPRETKAPPSEGLLPATDS